MSSYEIVAYIEKILIFRKISKADFYANTGISAAVLSNWRKGKNYPSMEALIAVNEYLGTDFAITVENEKTPARDALTDDERDIIRLYRNSSDQTRKSMLLFLRSLEADSLLRGV